MRFLYQQWDGSEFPTQGNASYFQNFMEYLIEYGEDALRALRDLENDPEQRKVIEQWLDEGLLEKVGVTFRLTPRAIGSIQRQALMEVFGNLRGGANEGHETPHAGVGGERMEGTRAYRFGDPVSDIDVSSTLRNAVMRHGPGLPLRLGEDDFEVHQSESQATCSTVILLDMSGSMRRWNRFAQAKRCAMAMFALIRQRFTLDTVDVIGFYSGAEVIPEAKLALATPKQVSLFDPEVRLRVPLAHLARAPQHFTNLQLGLNVARRLLVRRGGQNKQVFIITDGEPTAHVDGDTVHLIYPPAEATSLATLSEAVLLSRQGVRFSIFALVDDYAEMEWVSFVDHLAKLTRGVAFYCTSGDLANCVMESYLIGRKRRAFLA